MKVFSLRAIPIIAVMVLLASIALAPGVSAQTPPVETVDTLGTGAFVQAEGGQRYAVNTNSIGDIVGQLTPKDDGTCGGGFNIELSGSITRVRVTTDENCTVRVTRVGIVNNFFE